MTLPANIRINAAVLFPARAAGANFITVSKANGIYTIKADYTLLAPILGVADLTTKELVVLDLSSGKYNTITAAALIAAGTSTYRLVTAAGDVTILSSDVTILLNKTVGAATNIVLPTSASRNGLPVTVKDYKGDANTNNITFVPNGTETIDGFSPAAAIANGVALIDINTGKKTLFPLTSGGWYT